MPGGYIAFALLRRAPVRVEGLVLVNTRAAADSAEGLAARDRLAALAERDGAAGVASDMIPKLLGRTSRAEQPDLEGAVRRLIEANSTEGIVAAVQAMKARPDSTPLLPAIRCPTLVISGSEDAIIPDAEAEAMTRAIPGAQRMVISRAGHLTNLEAPRAFNEALSTFLGKTTTRAL